MACVVEMNMESLRGVRLKSPCKQKLELSYITLLVIQ